MVSGTSFWGMNRLYALITIVFLDIEKRGVVIEKDPVEEENRHLEPGLGFDPDLHINDGLSYV